MKRTFLILVVLVALPFTVSFGEEDDSKLSIVFMGSAAALNNVSDWSGGFSIGTQFPFPGLEKRGLHTRLIYSQFNINPEAPMRTIEPSVLVDFYVGKKYRIWWTAIGAEAYTDGMNHGVGMYTGIGISRRILTIGESSNSVGFDLFGETNFIGGDDEGTGNYIDLSLGLKLNKL